MPTLRSESDATVIWIWMTVLLLSVLPSPSLESAKFHMRTTVRFQG